MIGILDTGTSNIRSVINACTNNNIETIIIKEYETPKNFSGIIFPGVGNFGFVMKQLKKNKLDIFIKDFIKLNRPSLFICVGLQVLFSASEEDDEEKGLNIIEGFVKKIPIKFKDKINTVPFNGWNHIKLVKKHEILRHLKGEVNSFYFTHSYYVDPKQKDLILNEVNLNGFNYCSGIVKNNIIGFQFHPEKSSMKGVEIFKNFSDICKLKNIELK